MVSGQPGEYQIQPAQLQGQQIQSSGVIHPGSGESRNSKVRYVPGRRQGRGRIRKQTGNNQQQQVDFMSSIFIIK